MLDTGPLGPLASKRVCLPLLLPRLESADVSVVCIGWPEHRTSRGGDLKAQASLDLTFLMVFLMNFDGPVANGGVQLLTSPTWWRSYE